MRLGEALLFLPYLVLVVEAYANFWKHEGLMEEEVLQTETEEGVHPEAEEEPLQAEAAKREKSRWEALLLEAEVIAANLKESGTRR